MNLRSKLVEEKVEQTRWESFRDYWRLVSSKVLGFFGIPFCPECGSVWYCKDISPCCEWRSYFVCNAPIPKAKRHPKSKRTVCRKHFIARTPAPKKASGK